MISIQDCIVKSTVLSIVKLVVRLSAHSWRLADAVRAGCLSRATLEGSRPEAALQCLTTRRDWRLQEKQIRAKQGLKAWRERLRKGHGKDLKVMDGVQKRTAHAMRIIPMVCLSVHPASWCIPMGLACTIGCFLPVILYSPVPGHPSLHGMPQALRDALPHASRAMRFIEALLGAASLPRALLHASRAREFVKACEGREMCLGLLQEMEKGVKEFAAGVEQLVDRIVSGELGGEVAHQADRYMSGFFKRNR